MKYLRFHLSTAVIVTLLSGALLGLNLRPQHAVIKSWVYKSGKLAWAGVPGGIVLEDSYGWPAKCLNHAHFDPKYLTDETAWQSTWHEDEFFVYGIAANAAFAIGICFVSILLLERALARKRPEATPALTIIPLQETA